MTTIPPPNVFNSDSEDVPAQMQGSNDCGLARDDVKPDDTMQESRPARPATALSEAGGRFLIDEESFLYAIDPPPLPPLFIERALFELSR